MSLFSTGRRLDGSDIDFGNRGGRVGRGGGRRTGGRTFESDVKLEFDDSQGCFKYQTGFVSGLRQQFSQRAFDSETRSSKPPLPSKLRELGGSKVNIVLIDIEGRSRSQSNESVITRKSGGVQDYKESGILKTVNGDASYTPTAELLDHKFQWSRGSSPADSTLEVLSSYSRQIGEISLSNGNTVKMKSMKGSTFRDEVDQFRNKGILPKPARNSCEDEELTNQM